MSRKLIGFADNNQRHDMRRPLSAVTFTIAGNAYSVEDISLGGFRLADGAEKFRIGEEIIVSSVAASGKGRVNFNAKAEIVRMERDGKGVGAHFVGLSPRNFDIVESLIMRRPLVRRSR